MKKSIMILTAIAAISSSAQAQDECVDLAGSYVGQCAYVDSNDRENKQPLKMEISESSCSGLTLNGKKILFSDIKLDNKSTAELLKQNQDIYFLSADKTKIQSKHFKLEVKSGESGYTASANLEGLMFIDEDGFLVQTVEGNVDQGTTKYSYVLRCKLAKRDY